MIKQIMGIAQTAKRLPLRVKGFELIRKGQKYIIMAKLYPVGKTKIGSYSDLEKAKQGYFSLLKAVKGNTK